jgi:polyphosphate kinase
LVDFNDQRLGRLTLIRHLLAHVSDRKVPEVEISFPPLDHEPLTEQFGTPLKPIKPAST